MLSAAIYLLAHSLLLTLQRGGCELFSRCVAAL